MIHINPCAPNLLFLSLLVTLLCGTKPYTYFFFVFFPKRIVIKHSIVGILFWTKLISQPFPHGHFTGYGISLALTHAGSWWRNYGSCVMASVSQQKWLLFIHMVTTAQLVTLQKYTHSTSQSDFCLSGTHAILYSMSYWRVILGYVECCREEQYLISNSVCQPQNALECNKAFGESQTIRPGGIQYDNLPKNCS